MNWRKWLNWIGIALMLVGIAVCVGTWQRTGQSLFSPDGQRESFRRIEWALGGPDTRGLTVQESNGTVRIVKSGDEQFHVSCHETDRERLEWTEDAAGKLIIRRVSDEKWYNRIAVFPSVPECTMVVAIPDGYQGPVYIESSNGGIQAEEPCMTGELTLTTSNGRIAVSNQTVERLTAVSSNGKAELNDIVCRNGAMVHTSNAAVVLREVVCGGDLQIATSNGKIMLERVQSGNMFAETSNGSISGSLIGNADDYAISAHTSNGDVRLPEGTEDAEGKVELKTSNGDISIEFVE